MRHAYTQTELNRLSIENALWPKELKFWPKSEWPPLSLLPDDRKPAECWRSKDFLVQIYDYESHVRISVSRTMYEKERNVDGISWDELQRLKSECGRGDKCAVEIFPPDGDVVNVANMRHLFICDAPEFMWRKK